MDTTKHVEEMFEHTDEIFFIFGCTHNGEPITYMKKMAKYRDNDIEGLKEKIRHEMYNDVCTDIPVDARNDFTIYHGETEMPNAVYAALLKTHKYLPERQVKVYTLEQFLAIVKDCKQEEDIPMSNWQARCVFNAMFDSHNEVTTDVMAEHVMLFQEDPEQFNMPADLDECFERFKVPGEICKTYEEREGKHWEVTEETFNYFLEVMMPMALGWVKEHTRYAYIMSECLTGNLYDKFVETKEDGPSRFYYECVDITKDDDFKVLDPEYFWNECEECGNRFPDDQMTRTQDTDGYVCDGCINEEEEEY